MKIILIATLVASSFVTAEAALRPPSTKPRRVYLLASIPEVDDGSAGDKLESPGDRGSAFEPRSFVVVSPELLLPRTDRVRTGLTFQQATAGDCATAQDATDMETRHLERLTCGIRKINATPEGVAALRSVITLLNAAPSYSSENSANIDKLLELAQDVVNRVAFFGIAPELQTEVIAIYEELTRMYDSPDEVGDNYF